MIILVVVTSLIAVLAAVGVVVARTPVHSVLALVLNFIALAVLYLTLSAEFMAVIQLIIYAGAVMVLFLFVIALLTVRKEPLERDRPAFGPQERWALGLGAVLLALLSVAVYPRPNDLNAKLPAGFGSVRTFGDALLRDNVLPFELTAFVLLVAVIGVVVLVGRKNA